MIARLIGAAGLILAAATAASAQDQEFEITGDAEAGEKVFRKCMACHAVGEDAKNKVGPVLNDILGRTAGTVEEFSYSDAMISAGEGGMVWTPEELDAYLENPRKHVEGTKMSFAGLRKEDERADVIAYLATFSEEGGS